MAGRRKFRASGDELAGKSGSLIYRVLIHDVRGEGYKCIEHPEALTLQIPLDLSPIGVVLYAYYDAEGDQAMFSVRFGTDRVVPREHRDEAEKLLHALDHALLGGHFYLGPDGSIVLRDHLKAPLGFIQPGLYSETVKQIGFDAACHLASIETLLTAVEATKGSLGGAFAAVVAGMDLDLETFIHVIDDIVAITGLDDWDSAGIYPIEYIIRLALGLLSEE